MSFTNILLGKLSPPDIALLQPSLSMVDLRLHDTVDRAGSKVEHIYFVETGMLSLVSQYETGREIEIGMIGREGFSGVGVALDDAYAVYDTNVQVAGSAARISASDLSRAMSESRSLHLALLRFTRALEIQTASTASANGRAKLESRLARWLLMVQDRLDTDIFEITHEFLAQMLCCRRPGVTVALHLLEGKGLLRSTRGQIAILDRVGLEEEADGAYGRAEAEYTRLIGEDFRLRRTFGAGVKARALLSMVRSRDE
jgi:CRP-like cAMP-binding protein